LLLRGGRVDLEFAADPIAAGIETLSENAAGCPPVSTQT
jgi:hypothetical protein